MIMKMSREDTMAKSIDFWFSIGSTYTFLTVMRLESVSRESGVVFECRPFSVRVMMVEQNNIPFRGKPVKMAYMWRDIERRAQALGLSTVLPSPYPIEEFDLANQVAVLAAGEGWCLGYAKAFYRRWFQNGVDASVPNLLAEVVAAAGQEPGRVLEAARSPRIEEAYRLATDEARSLGVFGSPSFVVDGEVFWGDDRLEDAIAWRSSRHAEER
jgi:2-hydroxychromene-2-carboxylate isomerase